MLFLYVLLFFQDTVISDNQNQVGLSYWVQVEKLAKLMNGKIKKKIVPLWYQSTNTSNATKQWAQWEEATLKIIKNCMFFSSELL